MNLSEWIYAHEKQRESGEKKRVCTHLLAQCEGTSYLVEILSLVCHFGCLQLARFEIVIPLKPPFADVQGHTSSSTAPAATASARFSYRCTACSAELPDRQASSPSPNLW